MPLSEEELRLLEQMERALVAEDPKLASTLRGTSLRTYARRRALVAAVFFVIGVVVLMTGAVARLTLVGILGFVVMLLSASIGLTLWRSHSHGAESATQTTGEETAAEPFTVIEGGRKSGKRPRRKRGQTAKNGQHQSMMDRFEERWRRRREQSGF